MRAVIIAAGAADSRKGEMARNIPALRPLADRPFIQHVTEFLVAQGVTTIDFVFCRMAHEFDDLLGGGTRWGATFRSHLTRTPELAFARAVKLSAGNEPVLFANGHRLPLRRINGDVPTPGSPPLLYFSEDAAQDWTGWGWFLPEHFNGLAGNSSSDSFLRAVMNNKAVSLVVKTLAADPWSALLAANRAVLLKETAVLLIGAREVEPGIWLSRNVILHPTAELRPPVLIGENVQIGQRTVLGPVAVIGADCILDARSSIQNSVIMKSSYVGEALELDGVVVDRNRLINTHFNSETTVADNFILSHVAPKPLSQMVAEWLSQIFALCGVILFSPLLILTMLWLKCCRRGPLFTWARAVALPVQETPDGPMEFAFFHMLCDIRAGQRKRPAWRHFLQFVIPGLFAILRGKLRIVGLPPRSRVHLDNLTNDWMDLYLSSKAGLISEAFVRFGPDAAEDEQYAADACYAVTAGMWHDIMIGWGFLLLLIGELTKPQQRQHQPCGGVEHSSET